MHNFFDIYELKWIISTNEICEINKNEKYPEDIEPYKYRLKVAILNILFSEDKQLHVTGAQKWCNSETMWNRTHVYMNFTHCF